jgi:HSP20 family protein
MIMSKEVEKVKELKTDECVLMPPIDIYTSDDEYVIKADMPAVSKNDLQITLHDNKLEITGKVSADESKEGAVYNEYSLYNYYRSFQVGNDIDGERISAEVDKGVLTLKLPKKAESKPKKITIEVE